MNMLNQSKSCKEKTLKGIKIFPIFQISNIAGILSNLSIPDFLNIRATCNSFLHKQRFL